MNFVAFLVCVEQAEKKLNEKKCKKNLGMDIKAKILVDN